MERDEDKLIIKRALSIPSEFIGSQKIRLVGVADPKKRHEADVYYRLKPFDNCR